MWSWGACFFTFFYNQKLAPGYIDADYDNLTDPSAKCSSVIFHVQYKHRVIAAKMSTGIARRTQLASCAPPLLLAQLLHLEPEKIECPQLQERCHRAACRSKLSLFTLRFKIDTPYGVNGFAHIFALASGIICFGFMPGSPSTGWIADLIVRPSLGSKKPTRWLGCTARDTKQYEAIRSNTRHAQKSQKIFWAKRSKSAMRESSTKQTAETRVEMGLPRLKVSWDKKQEGFLQTIWNHQNISEHIRTICARGGTKRLTGSDMKRLSWLSLGTLGWYGITRNKEALSEIGASAESISKSNVAQFS